MCVCVCVVFDYGYQYNCNGNWIRKDSFPLTANTFFPFYTLMFNEWEISISVAFEQKSIVVHGCGDNYVLLIGALTQILIK